MLKKILLSACMLAMVPVAAISCSEEDHSSYLEPDLWAQVKLQMDFIELDKDSCDDVKVSGDLSNYITAHRNELRLACAADADELSYANERKRAGSPPNLGTTMKNSGYYAAIYIFLAKMDNTLKKCAATREQFKQMYEDAGCNDIIKDANTFYGDWGGY